MRYFAIALDGEKYGPADLEILNEWVADGRLSRESLLEREGDGERVLAGSVEGIEWDPSAPSMPPPPVVRPETTLEEPDPAPTHRWTVVQPPSSPAGHGGATQPGHEDWMMSLAFAIPAFFCPFINLPLAIGAYVFGRRAKAQGHPGAPTALIMAYTAIAYSALSAIASVWLLTQGGGVL